MDNVISTCYVIESKDFGVEPIIYLRYPITNALGNESVLPFPNPFKARAYIRKIWGDDTKVHVTKSQYSQLLNVK